MPESFFCFIHGPGFICVWLDHEQKKDRRLSVIHFNRNGPLRGWRSITAFRHHFLYFLLTLRSTPLSSLFYLFFIIDVVWTGREKKKRENGVSAIKRLILASFSIIFYLFEAKIKRRLSAHRLWIKTTSWLLTISTKKIKRIRDCESWSCVLSHLWSTVFHFSFVPSFFTFFLIISAHIYLFFYSFISL